MLLDLEKSPGEQRALATDAIGDDEERLEARLLAEVGDCAFESGGLVGLAVVEPVHFSNNVTEIRDDVGARRVDL